ncbi:MAG: hypothetical protein ACREBV_06055, partial [Candidatus Zixiibacteriota bacterium]
MGKLRMAMAGVLLFSALTAAETKVKGELYPQWHMDFSAGADHYCTFELARSYVTVTSDLNDRTSVRFTVDLRSTSGYSGYDIILKYGYVDWKPKFSDRVAARLGLQQTMYIDIMSKLWNRRYLEKTTGDLNGVLTTADLGASANLNLGSSGMAALNLAIFNGTSFTSVTDLNKQKDLNAVLALKPVQNNPDFKNSMILGQVYLGTQNVDFSGGLDADDYRKSIVSIGGILDYAERFSIGLDANWESLGDGLGNQDIDVSATSIFATYMLGRHAGEGSFVKNLNLFGRIDFVDPNGNVNDDGETYSIWGVECITSANIKTSLNVRLVSFEDSAVSGLSFLY